MRPVSGGLVLELTEAQWDDQLFAPKTGLAPTLGWTLSYHTLRSRGSESGFPDRVLVRERVVYLELKKATGKLSAAQKRWTLALLEAGAEIYVARPADFDDITAILRHRGDPWLNGRGQVVEAASVLRGRTRMEAQA